MYELGMLIVLICIVLPTAIVLGLIAIWMIIAVGALVPMYVAFGVGFLLKAIYRAITYVHPRRAIVD